METITSIFKLQPVIIRSLINNVSASFSSLSSLGSDGQISQSMPICLIMNKCDQQTRNKWIESLDYSSLPSWNQCDNVPERHCQYLVSSRTSSNQTRKPFHSKQNWSASNNALNSSFALTSTGHRPVSKLGFTATFRSGKKEWPVRQLPWQGS